MAESIEKLYLRYCNRVQRYMENDGYYQYLLELIAQSRPTVTQYNRVMNKTVDEKWLDAIEKALPDIHEIIARPRRFLRTVETIAPVEQVKRIGSETVRHLASHTQYISGMKGDDIMPSRLMTVENEESIDLYENRFVNTLIRKLVEFIEKRTAVLFWDTGDEQQSILKLDTNIEDDYEIIEYHLDMTVKNKQTYLENDNDKMDVFKRIDRVRRMVLDFRSSAFMQIMQDTAPVRTPIQRTNQIMKNPHYRACYELWQFLERYDKVGYEISVNETALDFDEDYLFQLYGTFAANYTVFKSLLETDQRRITEPPKRRRNVKPKFVKQIVEEFVDDYDIPDVEVRKVIIEEITRAQAEIERRTAQQQKEKAAKEKEKARLEKEKERERAQKAKEAERQKALKAKEAEKRKAQQQKEKEAEKARLAREKEKERARIAREKEKEKARQAKEKEREKERLAREKEKQREKARLAKEKQREKEKAQKAKEAEKEKARKQREKEAEKARLAKEKEKAAAKPEQAKQPAGAGAGTSRPAKKKSATAPKKAALKAERPEQEPATVSPEETGSSEPIAVAEQLPAQPVAAVIAQPQMPAAVEEIPPAPVAEEAAASAAPEPERPKEMPENHPEEPEEAEPPDEAHDHEAEAAPVPTDTEPSNAPEPEAPAGGKRERITDSKGLMGWIARRREAMKRQNRE